MGYASKGAVTKLAYGSFLAGALAYLMTRQRDAVGFIAFDDRVIDRLPASARPGHLRSVLIALDRLALGRQSDVSRPLHQLADTILKRSIAVLISDLLDDPVSVIRGLKHLRFRGTDVIVFHVLDRDELTFPFDRATKFRDLESDAEVLAVPAAVRDEYLKAVQDLCGVYERELRLSGIDYVRLDTSEPLDFALASYLSSREKRL
jgi:uncharacterized protein (DUF58 family)